MTLTLYHSAYSTCSQKVRLALAEKGLDYVSRELSFRKQEHLAPDYLKINPNGVLPSLLHDDRVITDSSVIMEYLEEAFPDPALSPSDAYGRAEMRKWMRFMEEVPTKAIRIPSFERIFLPTLRMLTRPAGFAQSAEQRTLRRGFYKKMNGGAGFDSHEIEESNHHLRMTIERIEAALADHGPWIMGEQLTLVDLALAPLIDRMLDLGLTRFFEGADATLSWMARLQDRPSFDKAFFKGARLSERPEFKFAQLRNWLGDRLGKSDSQQGAS